MSSLLRERYEVLATAGGGGQGTVLHALDLVHQRHVAIKVRELHSGRERQAVFEEARILLSVRPHPNLPLLREDFTEGERYYLIMDWIEGRNLAQVLEEEGTPGLPLKPVLDYLGQAAEALDHLHDHDPSVVHQDVKPANLVLTPDGRVLLVDFGISRYWQPYEGESRGTRDYAAPELARDAPTPASDIFSLAVTAYTLLTGAPPRPEVRPKLGDCSGEGVIRALRRGLAIDPARRPPSAAALVEALQAGAREARSASRRSHRQRRPVPALSRRHKPRRSGLAGGWGRKLAVTGALIMLTVLVITDLPGSPCLAGVQDRTSYAPYPDGTLVEEPGVNGDFIVAGGALFRIPDPSVFLGMGFQWAQIRPQPLGALSPYLKVAAPQDGTAIRDFGSPRVYIVFGGAGFPAADRSEFRSVDGKSDAHIVVVPPGVTTLVVQNRPRDGTLYRERKSSRIFVARDGQLQPATACMSAKVLVVPQGSLGERFS